MDADLVASLVSDLVARHGEHQRLRAERGVAQVLGLWADTDGDREELVAFVGDNFVADDRTLDLLFDRLETALEQLDGLTSEIQRELRLWTDLDIGPALPIDLMLASHDPAGHVIEDLFASKVAFVALLNFWAAPASVRLEQGASWSRGQWAEVRVASRFASRTPAVVNSAFSSASAAAEAYIAGYDIWMHHVLDEDGRRLFPSGLRLVSHWGLREQIKEGYCDGPDGIRRQRLVARILERIIDQSIPECVVNEPCVDWQPFSNAVTAAPDHAVERASPAGAVDPDPSREPDTRYSHLVAVQRAARALDRFSPATPSVAERQFDANGMTEDRVEEMLLAVVASPLVTEVAALVERDLGRALEPFDVWYDGFRSAGDLTPAELDALVRGRYPDAAAFNADIPRILEELGFSPARAVEVAGSVEFEASRGSGHALVSPRRGDRPRLRSRVEPTGMDYKAYDIAVHELGHAVAGVFSVGGIDHPALAGVPNAAIDEALAYVFQHRNRQLLGVAAADSDAGSRGVLHDFWMTYEIAGPALVNLEVVRWLYAHPDASAADLRSASVLICEDIWARHYRTFLGGRDSPLLGSYSHMMFAPLYLPEYPVALLVARQLGEHFRELATPLGEEFERVSSFGALTPDLWMRNATGEDVSAEPLLRAVAGALDSET